MKLLILLLAVGSIVGINRGFAQGGIKADPDAKPDVWDIQPTLTGSIMYLDVPYKGHNDTTEYLTLSVSKDSGATRPSFISVMVQSPIVQSKGLFLTFGEMVIDTTRTIHIQPNQELQTGIGYEDCNSQFCTARILKGYASRGPKKEKADIFEEFMRYPVVLFLFFYPDGSHRSISVPLESFKIQYKLLK